MIHANGNKICAIDVETTGLDYKKNDIIEIAVVPLDYNLEPDPNYAPFWLDMAPQKFDNIDYSFIRKNKIDHLQRNGFDPYVALDIFIEWIERLELPIGKRIMPLAQNWVFDRAFIMEWMGSESFNFYIDGRYRDLMSLSLFINDSDDFHNQPCHFAKNKLSYICCQLNLECERELFHGAQYDAVKTAEAYRKLCIMTKCFQ